MIIYFLIHNRFFIFVFLICEPNMPFNAGQILQLVAKTERHAKYFLFSKMTKQIKNAKICKILFCSYSFSF